MIVVTTENGPGHRVRDVKGQCFGVVVRSRGIGGNFMAGLRSIVGGPEGWDRTPENSPIRAPARPWWCITTRGPANASTSPIPVVDGAALIPLAE
jgi:hypothetical protein